MALLTGTHLGAYEIVAPLGAGGMSEVYKARDMRLDRIVAIKVLRAHVAADPRRRQRFEREARVISQLNHPHICTLHDVGHQDGVDFLVMEYLEGETLAERIAAASRGSEGPGLAVDEALGIAIQIADALQAAHQCGIVHRDLKPANVMLTKTGPPRQGSPHVKLLDFGIAKAVGPVDAGYHVRARPTDVVSSDGPPASAETSAPPTVRTLTVDGTLVGTLQYMSPEQLGGGRADARSDLFAFGAVVYEMLTGRRAFGGESQSAVIAAVLDREPPPISLSQPRTPVAFEQVVTGCLAKDPNERCQSADHVKGLLQEIAVDLNTAGRPRRLWPSSASSQPAWDMVSTSARPRVGAGFQEPRRSWMPLWLALFLIPLGIEALGLVMSAAFIRTIGLGERFAREAPGKEFYWALRSLVAPTGLFALIAVAISLARIPGRMLWSRFSTVQRVGRFVGRPLSAFVQKLGLDDPLIFAQAAAVLGAVALVAILWRFSDLIYAFSHPISEMLPEQLSALGGVEPTRFRLALTWLVFVLGFATWRTFRVRARSGQIGHAGWPAAGAVVLLASIALLETPYRVLYHAEFERADLNGITCYVVGENRVEVLLHCPTAPPPRNRTVKPDDSDLKRLGRQESIFQSSP
jgi:serine/threonine protein kinase